MNRVETIADIERLDFGRGAGLVTVVTQDDRDGTVLMVAHADHEALVRTIETGEMHYRSRTRGLWHKGATSGNRQTLVALFHDCDSDAVLARVIPLGPACHTGARSCFSHDGALSPAQVFEQLSDTIRDRAAAGADTAGESYTQRLLRDRNLRLKKIGEEAAELTVACADDDPARAAEEGADLIYHALVALRGAGVDVRDVARVLEARMERGKQADPGPSPSLF